jgi:lipid-A-disaccharide synthase
LREPRLLLSCGEPSGDAYGGELLRHLRALAPGLTAMGLGGDHVQAQGAHLVAHVRELAVVGILEVVRHLRRLRRIFDRLLAEVDRNRPDVAVLVDYPDFNLRLARKLKLRGIPVVYYISPQVWAWRRGRIRSIRETVARMVVIFPFEERLYQDAGVPVTFVGHPLVDLVKPAPDRRALLESLGLRPEATVVSLLPGSRPQEVAHNLPPLVGAAAEMSRRRPDLRFLLAVAPALDRTAVRAPFGNLPVAAVQGQTHAALEAAQVAVVASGTATVEAALLGTPMVVVYRVSPLTYALGRPLVRVPHYAMVNLIAERRVVTELIQADFTPERVAAEALGLLEDPDRLDSMRDALLTVRQKLGEPGASARAAAAVKGEVSAWGGEGGDNKKA